MLRRNLLLGPLAAGAALSLRPISALAQFSCAYSPSAGARQPLVGRVLATPDNTYSTYPHSNGFMPDGRLVIAEPEGEGIIRYSAVDLAAGAPFASPLAEIKGARMYYCVSRTALMIAPTLFGATVVDLNNAGKLILQWEDPEYLTDPARFSGMLRISQDIDISADGSRALLTRDIYGQNKQLVQSSVLLLDISAGAATTIAQLPNDPATGEAIPLDHAHFCPADPDWVCFCDGINRTTRRMWVWHATLANPARLLFDQSAQAKPLLFTHERALFDRVSLLTVAYGASPGTPRGLYEVPLSGAPPQFVSESNLDLHCNASRDGRWYVVSLQGTAIVESNVGILDLCARAGGASDPDWLTSAKGYSFSDVVVVNPKTGARAFLFRGANANVGQPYEVQPSISPDGLWVVIKDARRSNVLCLEINQSALLEFLAG